MNLVTLSPEDLLAGTRTTYELVIPQTVLNPVHSANNGEKKEEMMVELRPLSIGAFQLIMKAAKNNPSLVPLLMIREALVAPKLSVEQIQNLHLGLVKFLIQQIRQISGLEEKKNT